MSPDSPNVPPSGELVCVGCGYDLRASQAFGRCPACDRPVSDAPASRRSPAGNVDADVHCVTCGYNLRGLDAAGRCPECGTAVHLSYRGDLLRYANPEWLAKVKLGADLLLLGIVGSIALGATVGCLGGLLGARPSIRVWIVQPGVLFAFGLLHVVAVFLLTAQEPRITLTESGLTWRRVVRAAAVVALLSGWTSAFASISSIPLRTALVTATMIIGIIVVPIKTFGEFAYAGALAARVPDARLVRSTRRVKWGLTIGEFLLPAMGYGTSLVLSWLGPRAPGGPASGSPPIVWSGSGGPSRGMVFSGGAPPWPIVIATGLAMAVVSICLLVYQIWALILLLRYRRVLREALATARTSRPAPTTTPSSCG